MDSICNTCLSRGRKMYYIGEFQSVLHCLTPELRDVINTLNICWECRAILKKFSSFRNQVLQAHTLMIDPSVKRDLEDFSIPWLERHHTFSSLVSKHKTDYDYTYESTLHNTDSEDDAHDADNVVVMQLPERRVLKKVNIVKINTKLPLFDGKGKLLIKNVQANLSKKDPIAPETKIKSESDNSDIEENMKLSVIKNATKRTVKKVTRMKAGERRKRVVENEVDDFNYVPSESEVLEYFENNMKKALHANVIKNVTLNIMTAEELQEHRDSLKCEPNYASSEFKCDKCIVGYYTQELFNDHDKVQHHKGNKIHSLLCPICSSYVDKSMFLFHYGRHIVSYTCGICNIRLVDIKVMRSHQAKHRNELNRYYCERCTMEFKTSYHLRLHNNRRHGEPMLYKRPRLVTRSIPKETSSRSYDCVLCDYKFQSRGKMKQHVETAHSNREEKYHCSKCNITCNSFLSYKKHFRYARAHINDSPGKVKYICPYCGKPFTVNFVMKEHINYVHNGKTDYVCHLCNKMLSSKGSLTKHIKYVHEGIKLAKDRPCNICGKFYNAATLRSHIRIHSDARPFICKVCGDSFKQSGSLYTHIRLKHKRNNTEICQ